MIVVELPVGKLFIFNEPVTTRLPLTVNSPLKVWSP